jgi:hypothetical protein
MDMWYEMALQNNFPYIDEFDQLEADLNPFRVLDASTIKRRMENAVLANAQVTEARRLGWLEVRRGKLSVEGFSFVEISNETMIEMIEPIAHHLPDLRLPVNWFPQPRVVGGDMTRAKDSVRFEDRSAIDNWNYLRSACPSSYLGDARSSRDRPTLDICAWQASNRHEHGIFVAPVSFFTTTTAVPILSRGKLSTMQDLLIPNPCYWADRYRLWSEPDPLTFKQKSISVYWRGQTTGVVLSAETLYQTHRMRFVNLFNWLAAWYKIQQDPNPSLHVRHAFEQAEKMRKAAQIHVDVEKLYAADRFSASSFDVGFDRVFNVSDADFAATVQKEYRFTPREFPREMYRHQFVADIDGESMSCRFYSQLASASVPIKQTLFAEWHDDRVVPWAHYVPLSHSMQELPALLAWLSTNEGQKIAERIALAGQAWAGKTLRKIDMTLYLYRLLLEYAAVMQ